jgi:hypothetical protein
MNRKQGPTFKVRLALMAAGPVRLRTKHKENKLLRADACITLPFMPYPGLYLTLERPRKRGEPQSLYLRVRTVEWAISKHEFVCVVDEMLGSNVFLETMEVREPPRIEQHYIELQKLLVRFGFTVQTDYSSYTAFDKYADGTSIDPPTPFQPPSPPRRRRWGGY